MDWPPPTSRGLLEWAAARYGQAEAVVHGARRFSFGQVLEASCRLAAGLAARGIRRGDRVGIWLPNWPEWIFARHALGILGAVVVPINTRYKAEELAYCLRQGECRALLAADRFLGIDFRGMVDAVCGDLPMLDCLCGERLAKFKVPRQVVFVEDYPRTATGKIQRAKLKDVWTSS